MPNPICPTGTTYVPGPRFKSGVKAKDVCIDTKPVSNKSYNEFLKRRNKTLSSYRRATKPSDPVEGVSYNDARKYCQFRGMRLLTHTEWQRAFLKSRHSLFSFSSLPQMGIMKDWSWTRSEFVIASRSDVCIIGRFLGQRFGFSYGGPSLMGGGAIFRCAVEPNTFWIKGIIGLVAGILLAVARVIPGMEKSFSK